MNKYLRVAGSFDSRPRTTLRAILLAIQESGEYLWSDVCQEPSRAAPWLAELIQTGGNNLLDQARYVETNMYVLSATRVWIMLPEETPEGVLDEGDGWQLIQQISPNPPTFSGLTAIH